MTIMPQVNRVRADGIPKELRECPQWVCWRFESRNGKPTKVPYQANGRRSKCDDPTTWTSFADAHSAYQHHHFAGISFVFVADDDFLGIDLDACYDPDTGELTDWAQKIVKDFASYTEVSPSGFGVKIVARGKLPIPDDKSGRAKKLKDVATFGDKEPEIATYDKLRFWCLTGERLADSPVTCEPRQEQVTALFERLFSRNGKPKEASSSGSKPSGSLYDRLISDCQHAQNGERSERDFALCAAAHRFGWDKETVWQDVQGIGKFAERGEEYFSRTWENAQERTRERIYSRDTHSNTNPTEIKSPYCGTEATLGSVADVPNLADPEGRTDLANARRLIAMYRDRLLYCHPWKKWMVWDGMRWRLDEDGSVMRLAKSVADAVWAEARELDGLDAAMLHAVRTASNRSVKAILSLAASDVPVMPAQLDSNPWLFNCPNGTLDLRTGELRAHRREDYITKLCPTEYDPDAVSLTWNQFLEGVFAGSQPIIEFLQRLCGYAITGDQREQILPILWGDGSNGKSTLLNAILHAVGPNYAMQAAPDLLMVKRGETHPTDKADLFGKRIVSCIETDEGRQFSESFVKMLTGGERVRARRMREDFWEFAATHTVFLATNHKPEVKGDDHSIWRRLALIPFVVTFWNPEKGEFGPEELKQDKTLPTQLEAQAPGILAWAVRGCRDWQAGGLKVPTEVRAATSRYQIEEDRISTFIEENCFVGAAFRVRGGQLYGAYKKWCEVIGEAPMTMTKFGRRIKKRSEVTGDRSNGTWYNGIGLRDDQEPHS